MENPAGPTAHWNQRSARKQRYWLRCTWLLIWSPDAVERARSGYLTRGPAPTAGRQHLPAPVQPTQEYRCCWSTWPCRCRSRSVSGLWVTFLRGPRYDDVVKEAPRRPVCSICSV